jgi:hypothetical protein
LWHNLHNHVSKLTPHILLSPLSTGYGDVHQTTPATVTTSIRSTSTPNHEPPTIPSKNLKEMAFKRHGDVIHQALTEAKNLGERQIVHELIRRVRKHMEAQRIIARDLLDEEEQ